MQNNVVPAILTVAPSQGAAAGTGLPHAQPVLPDAASSAGALDFAALLQGESLPTEDLSAANGIVPSAALMVKPANSGNGTSEGSAQDLVGLPSDAPALSEAQAAAFVATSGAAAGLLNGVIATEDGPVSVAAALPAAQPDAETPDALAPLKGEDTKRATAVAATTAQQMQERQALLPATKLHIEQPGAKLRTQPKQPIADDVEAASAALVRNVTNTASGQATSADRAQVKAASDDATDQANPSKTAPVSAEAKSQPMPATPQLQDPKSQLMTSVAAAPLTGLSQTATTNSDTQIKAPQATAQNGSRLATQSQAPASAGSTHVPAQPSKPQQAIDPDTVMDTAIDNEAGETTASSMSQIAAAALTRSNRKAAAAGNVPPRPDQAGEKTINDLPQEAQKMVERIVVKPAQAEPVRGVTVAEAVTANAKPADTQPGSKATAEALAAPKAAPLAESKLADAPASAASANPNPAAEKAAPAALANASAQTRLNRTMPSPNEQPVPTELRSEGDTPAATTKEQVAYDTTKVQGDLKAELKAEMKPGVTQAASAPAQPTAQAPAQAMMAGAEASSQQQAVQAMAQSNVSATAEAAQPQAATQPAPMARSLVMTDREWPTQLTAMVKEARDLTQGDIEIALQPERLGRMTIRMEMRDNQVSVSILTDNDASARLLNDNQSKLADLMTKAGLDLTQHNASSGQQGREQAGLGQNAGGNSGNGQGQSGDDAQLATAQILGSETANMNEAADDSGIDILA